MNFKTYLKLSEIFAEPAPTTASEAGYLYHATNVERLYEIKATGFLKTFPPWFGTDQRAWPDGSREKRSYWSQTAGGVWHFAPEEGRPVVVRTKMTPIFKRESTGDWYTTKKIPTALLEVLLGDGRWVSLQLI